MGLKQSVVHGVEALVSILKIFTDFCSIDRFVTNRMLVSQHHYGCSVRRQDLPQHDALQSDLEQEGVRCGQEEDQENGNLRDDPASAEEFSSAS